MKRLRIATFAAAALSLAPWAISPAAAEESHTPPPSATSLRAAVTTALGADSGTPVAAKLERHDDETVYEIAIATSKGISTVSVDPATGRIVETDTRGLLARLFDDEEEDGTNAAKLKIDLPRVLASVENTTRSPVVAAVLRTRHGAARYIVRTEDSVVAVDAATGMPTAIRDGDLHALAEDID